jgi:hypothetical protein
VFGVRPRAQTGTETQGQELSAHVRGWSCTLDAVAALGAVDCPVALCGTHRASCADRCLARRMAKGQRCSLAVMQPHLAGLLVSCPGLCYCAHQPHRASRSKERRLGRHTGGKQERKCSASQHARRNTCSSNFCSLIHSPFRSRCHACRAVVLSDITVKSFRAL